MVLIASWWNKVKNAYYRRIKFGMKTKKNLASLSRIWRDISREKAAFWNCVSFKLGTSRDIHFWENLLD